MLKNIVKTPGDLTNEIWNNWKEKLISTKKQFLVDLKGAMTDAEEDKCFSDHSFPV